MSLVIRDGKGNFFDLIQYPDGQQNVKLKLDMLNVKELVYIQCSIKNFKELEVLLCVIAALKANDFNIAEIQFKYLFGLRSDRAFEAGMPNYVKDVLWPIINNIKICCSFLVPHCPLFIAVQEKISKLGSIKSDSYSDCIFVGGDKSSSYEIQGSNEDIHFDKKRNGDSVEVELPKEFIFKIAEDSRDTILIYDDICDGGATFIAEAKYLRKHFPTKVLHLLVCHGIFSKGVDIVADHFDKIICTNSYQEINHPKVELINVFSE